MPACSAGDCDKQATAKGLCQTHYMRVRRGGSVAEGIPVLGHAPLKQRLLRHVNKTTKCWLWTASKGPKGYGQMWGGKGPRLAHRVSWEVHKGPIPEGRFVLHKCDTPLCVRPGHLFLGDQAMNMADKMEKKRHRYGTTTGEQHPRAKLTEADVRTIRASTATTYALAKHYGVSQATLWAARHGKSWRHLT